MKRTLIFFATINIIMIIALNIWPLQAVDVSQLQGMPPFKNKVEEGSQRTVSWKHELSQTFTPRKNNISGVAFYSVPTSKLINRDFLLSIIQGNKTLKKIRLNTLQIKRGLNIYFFKPVKIKQQLATIKLSAVRKNFYYMLVWKTNENVYNKGSVFVNDRQEINEDIVFKTYYSTSFFNLLTKRIAPDIPIISFLFLVPLFEAIFFSTAYLLDKMLIIINESLYRKS